MQTTLVIGYGNTLRNDDGAGQIVAEAVASWNLPAVRSRSLPQLYPELAAEMAEVELVIFVDAYLAIANQSVKICSLEPLNSIPIRSHFSDPRGLLSLTQTLYHCFPQAWWILIPGENFELGDSLSPLAQSGINQSVRAVIELIEYGEVKQ